MNRHVALSHFEKPCRGNNTCWFSVYRYLKIIINLVVECRFFSEECGIPWLSFGGYWIGDERTRLNVKGTRNQDLVTSSSCGRACCLLSKEPCCDRNVKISPSVLMNSKHLIADFFPFAFFLFCLRQAGSKSQRTGKDGSHGTLNFLSARWVGYHAQTEWIAWKKQIAHRYNRTLAHRYNKTADSGPVDSSSSLRWGA